MATPIQPDSFMRQMAEALVELNANLYSAREFVLPPRAEALSPAEEALIPEAKAQWRPKGLPVAEIDCELVIPGQDALYLPLRVWGRFTPATKGGHEPGERAYEPDDEAGFVLEAAFLGESDITGDIGDHGERVLCAYVMENCE